MGGQVVEEERASRRVRWVAVDMSTQGQILSHLRKKYKSRVEIKRLMGIMKKGRGGIVPCQKGNGVDKHRYTIHAWPFRLRCGLSSCHHYLQEAPAFEWFAKLVNDGHVQMEDIGMSPRQVDNRVSNMIGLG